MKMKQNVKCPYLQNGICYHAYCIYKPNLQCNKRETIKLSKKNKTRVKTAKNKYYPIKKVRKLMDEMFIIVKEE